MASIKKIAFWSLIPIVLFLLLLVCVIAYVYGQAEPWPDPPSPPVDLTLPYPVLTEANLTPDNGLYHLRQLKSYLETNAFPTAVEEKLSRYSPEDLDNIHSYTNLVQLPETHPKILTHWLAAAQAPQFQHITISSFDKLVPLAPTLLRTAKYARFQIDLHAQTGNWPAFESLLHTSLINTKRFPKGGTTLDYIIGVGLLSFALESCTSPELMENMPASTRQNLVESLPKWEWERADITDLIRAEWRLVAPHMREILTTGEFQTGPFTPERQEVFDDYPLARLFGSGPEKTLSNLETAFQHFARDFEHPNTTTSTIQTFIKQLHHDLHPLITPDPIGRAYLVINEDLFNRLREKANRCNAKLNGIALALTIDQYKAAEGTLPKTLGELVPDYLDQIPADPCSISGSPFTYRTTTNGTFQLYSNGKNQVDDNAEKHSDDIICRAPDRSTPP